MAHSSTPPHEVAHLQTENRALQAQLTTLQARYDRLDQSLHTTPLAVVEWDLVGIIQRWNASATRIFGWTADEALGQSTFNTIIAQVAYTQVQQVVADIVSGQYATSRNANLTKDGRQIMCQWYNAPLYDSDGTVVGILSQAEDVTAQIQDEAEREMLQQRVIDAQRIALRELSMPIIPIAQHVVVMPLIGAIDAERAQQIIETVLAGVAEQRATTAIIDITGVPLVDTLVAMALTRTAQAVKLLGAQAVITGIRPDVAHTLASLGVDLSSITTRSSLQRGIAYALQRGA